MTALARTYFASHAARPSGRCPMRRLLAANRVPRLPLSHETEHAHPRSRTRCNAAEHHQCTRTGSRSHTVEAAGAARARRLLHSTAGSRSTGAICERPYRTTVTLTYFKGARFRRNDRVRTEKE